jgi:hypothetical protein
MIEVAFIRNRIELFILIMVDAMVIIRGATNIIWQTGWGKIITSISLAGFLKSI